MRGYVGEVKNTVKEKTPKPSCAIWTYVWPIKKSGIQQRDNDM